MKININISNRGVYTFIAVMLILVVAGIAYAATDKSGAWHSSNTIEVSVDGNTKSLQEAIDAGDFSAGIGTIEAKWFQDTCPAGWVDTNVDDCDSDDSTYQIGHSVQEDSCKEAYRGTFKLCLRISEQA